MVRRLNSKIMTHYDFGTVRPLLFEELYFILSEPNLTRKSLIIPNISDSISRLKNREQAEPNDIATSCQILDTTYRLL